MAEERLWSLMAACDVLVNLRSPTMGETSGAVIRGLSLGKAMLVSDVGWFSELPDERGAEDPGRRVRGADDRGGARARRRSQGRARRGGARLRARASTTWTASADAYGAALEEAAGGDAVADAVLWRIAEAAAEVGIDDVSELALAGTRGGARVAVSMATRGRAVAGWPRGRARARAVAVPAWVWLTGIVVALDRGADRARAEDGRALDHDRRDRLLRAREVVRGRTASSSSAACRATATASSTRSLIAPAWRLFGAVPDAYAAAKAINAVVMSLAAIPAYFLARRVLAPAARARRGGADGRSCRRCSTPAR